MTSIITYDDLKMCAALKNLAEDKEQHLDWLEGLLYRVTPDYENERVQTSTGQDRMAERLEEYDQYEKAMRVDIRAYMQHVVAIENELKRLPKPEQQQVMRLYYIEGMTWAEIEECMCYSERQCRRYRDDALRILGISKYVRQCPPKVV